MCGNPFNDCKSRWYHQPVFEEMGGKVIKVCANCPERGQCQKHNSITKYLGDVSIIGRKGKSILLQEHHNIGKALLEWYGTAEHSIQVPGLPDWNICQCATSPFCIACGGNPENHNHYVRVRLNNDYIHSMTINNARIALVSKSMLTPEDYQITGNAWAAIVEYQHQLLSNTTKCSKVG